LPFEDRQHQRFAGYLFQWFSLDRDLHFF
jgi:hypothetical protein